MTMDHFEWARFLLAGILLVGLVGLSVAFWGALVLTRNAVFAWIALGLSFALAVFTTLRFLRIPEAASR